MPERIISLVPSITELLFSLGLNEEVVGITKFCVHPKEWFQFKVRIGGTKNLNIEKIKSLQPTLIIANKEENVKEQVEGLAKDFNVLLTDVNNYEEALQMIEQVGNAVGKGFEAKELISEIKNHFLQLKPVYKKTATYLIWQNPYMAVGGDTFISDMMRRAGFENVFENRDRYPEISLEEIRKLNPKFVLLSSEPYPFKQKHADELRQQLPDSKIILVDGEMFSWYGSRMLLAAHYLKAITN